MSEKFWEIKKLDELNEQEWDALCDRCGRCCLHKLEDDCTEEVFYTRVSCRLLDISTCQCRDFPNRHQFVPDCLQLDAKTAVEYDWLPETCAYRLRAAGQPLAWWHPLVSGDVNTVHEAGISVRHFAVSEAGVSNENFESFVIDKPTKPKR